MKRLDREQIMEFFRSFDDESILDILTVDDVHEIALECSAHNEHLYQIVDSAFSLDSER